MTEREYQSNFSEIHAGVTYDIKSRQRKGDKIIAVLDHFFQGKLERLSALDVGCSTGIISSVLSKRFAKVVGIDIDKAAISYAQKAFAGPGLQFVLQDGLKIDTPDDSFDVVVCAHVYEHVPDPVVLMDEIYRVLKPGGVCYFAGGNRLSLIEPHYQLPLLSVVPKPVAHLYLRLLKKGERYYEKHLTYWGLRKLVQRFELIDYCIEIIKNPARFSATEMIAPGSLKQKLAQLTLRTVYWLCPTYIWLLQKR